MTPHLHTDPELLAEALGRSAYLAYSMCLAGSATPRHIEYFKWAKDVKVGQLVVEISTRGRRPAIDRLGVLMSVTQESLPGQDEAGDGSAGKRTVWTIERLNGKVTAWEDCEFIAVPSRRDPDPFAF